MKHLLILVLLQLFSQVFASAEEVDIDTSADHLIITDIQVKEISTTKQNLLSAFALGEQCPKVSDLGLKASPQNLSSTVIVIDQLINIGKKIWSIVEAGKPVMNVKTNSATALPKGVDCWLDLQGWRAPIAKTYEVKATNAFGAEVVQFQYKVLLLYGGNYEGVGQYIGHMSVQPVHVSVMWGFDFSATAGVPVIFNMGSKQNPLAGAQIQIQYKIESVLRTIEQTQTYTVTGSGEIRKL